MAGITIGLGFVAAYAKFKATKPDITELLEVGRNQFAALHLIEWIVIPILIVAGYFVSRQVRLLSIVMLLVFAIQMLLILPALDERMVRAISGENLPTSNLHLYYVANAFLLVLGLIGCGFLSMNDENPEAGMPSEN
jgi:quinol-cytochrome oxidoreductase complex cytochrome b subunit